MLSRDQVMRLGVTDPQGESLWNEVRHMTHNQILAKMREEQVMASRAFKGDRPEDAEIKRLMVRRSMLLETFAWRIYMFGSEPMALNPGRSGELRKRQRMDPKYWRYLDQSNARHNTQGCEQLNNLYRKAKVPCARKGCDHQGQKHADKWLKSEMRREWEVMTRRFRY